MLILPTRVDLVLLMLLNAYLRGQVFHLFQREKGVVLRVGPATVVQVGGATLCGVVAWMGHVMP